MVNKITVVGAGNVGATAAQRLAEKELAEIRVIEDFLPRQLTAAEVEAAIEAAIGELGASTIRDMGRVMAHLKARHAGQMDFAAAGARVKAHLA